MEEYQLPGSELSEPSISPKDIIEEAERIRKIMLITPKNDLLIIKSANSWLEEAKVKPIPQMLFSEFWHEGELCILFADTNLGKSILAVQIANSISRGEAIEGFKLETLKQTVLLCDFEMSTKQFENRYSKNFTSHYQFDDGFKRIELNPDAELPEYETFEEYLFRSLERSLVETNAKILMIDNLTYLKTETEKAKDALPLMKLLKKLKAKYELSILALAHTPKRDLSKVITRNDLQGSKMLINFCDSSFSIGESHSDIAIRYLKQIKARNTEIIFDTDNVCVCRIDKPGNFLGFSYIGTGTEKEHLRIHTDKEKQHYSERVLELKNQGKSLREIAEELGTSHMKVQRILKSCNKT